MEKLYDIAYLTASTLTGPVHAGAAATDVNHALPLDQKLVERGLVMAQRLHFYVARHHRGMDELATKLNNVILEAALPLKLTTDV